MHTDWGHSRAGGCSHKHPINCLSWPRWQWRRRRRSNSHERSSQNTEYERVNDGWLQPQKTLERPNQGCGVMFPERASSQHGASHPRPTSPGGSSQSGGKVPSQDVGNSCLAWIGAHLQRRGPAQGQGLFKRVLHFPSISQFLYGTVCMYVQVCPGTEYSQMRCRTGLMRYDRSLALTLGVMSSILLFRQSACITSSVMSCPACCEPETGAQRSRILGAPANTRRVGGAPF